MIGLSVLASDMKPRLPDSWIQNQSFPIYLTSRGLIITRKAAISTQLGSIFRQDFRVVRTKSSGFLKHLSGQMKHSAMALVGFDIAGVGIHSGIIMARFPNRAGSEVTLNVLSCGSSTVPDIFCKGTHAKLAICGGSPYLYSPQPISFNPIRFTELKRKDEPRFLPVWEMQAVRI